MISRRARILVLHRIFGLAILLVLAAWAASAFLHLGIQVRKWQGLLALDIRHGVARFTLDRSTRYVHYETTWIAETVPVRFVRPWGGNLAWRHGAFKGQFQGHLDVEVPFAVMLLVVGIPFALVGPPVRNRCAHHLCKRCGYDLRGCVSDRCSECGMGYRRRSEPEALAALRRFRLTRAFHQVLVAVGVLCLMAWLSGMTCEFATCHRLVNRANSGAISLSEARAVSAATRYYREQGKDPDSASVTARPYRSFWLVSFTYRDGERSHAMVLPNQQVRELTRESIDVPRRMNGSDPRLSADNLLP